VAQHNAPRFASRQSLELVSDSLAGAAETFGSAEFLGNNR
jgi:hypothetical protein